MTAKERLYLPIEKFKKYDLGKYILIRLCEEDITTLSLSSKLGIKEESLLNSLRGFKLDLTLEQIETILWILDGATLSTRKSQQKLPIHGLEQTFVNLDKNVGKITSMLNTNYEKNKISSPFGTAIKSTIKEKKTSKQDK